MRVLSSAFCRLKTKLPWVPADTKLSKLDTLRLATIYIRQLRMRLSGDDDSSQMSQQTQKFQIEAPTSINGNQQSLVIRETEQMIFVKVKQNGVKKKISTQIQNEKKKKMICLFKSFPQSKEASLCLKTI